MTNPIENGHTETKTRKIREDLFVFATPDPRPGILPSPAVILSEGEMVLIGLGTPEGFPGLLAALKTLLPLDCLTHVVVPGFAERIVSSREVFREAGADPAFVVSENLDALLGLSSRGFRLKRIGSGRSDLVLRSGRVLSFIPAPFLISPMAFLTFDVQGKTLFSHFLWERFPQEDSMEGRTLPILGIEDFLAELVPSSDFVHPLIRTLRSLDAEWAVTESGKVWKRDEIEEIESALGEFAFSRRENPDSLPEKTERFLDYAGLSGRILGTLRDRFGSDAVRKAFGDSDIYLDPETFRITSVLEGKALWDRLFADLFRAGGWEWMKAAEPQMERFESQYGISRPAVFSDLLAESGKQIETLRSERDALQTRVSLLEEGLTSAVEKMTRDPLTGHFNELYLEEWLSREIPAHLPPSPDLQLYYLQIDNLLVINSKYSPKAGDETIRNLGFLLEQLIRPGDFLVKRNGPGFILAVPDPEGRVPAAFARTLQNAVRNSEAFIEPITLSVALVRLSEFLPSADLKILGPRMRSVGEARIKSAALARDLFIDESTRIEDRKTGRILIADREEINVRLLESLFFNENFEVRTALDGLAALEAAKEMKFDAVFAERTIPKLDGILLKQALNQVAVNAETPFILLTYRKTPDLVRQANQCGIDAVVAKPVIFEELVGLVRRTMKKVGK